MNFSPAIVVARKELMDGFRDKRAIYTVLISTLFGPLLIAFMLNQFAGQQRAAQEIKIPIVGRQYGPVLVHWLEQQQGVELKDGPVDAEAAVRDKNEEFVLVIDKDFADKFGESRSAPVKVVSDSTRESIVPKVKRLRKLLEGFNGQMAAMRLIAHGVSPSISRVLKVEDVEISNAQQQSAVIFNSIPLFLIAAAFTVAMQLSTDATAGERERGSLEPRLINPVARWQFIGGKWLAAALVAGRNGRYFSSYGLHHDSAPAGRSGNSQPFRCARMPASGYYAAAYRPACSGYANLSGMLREILQRSTELHELPDPRCRAAGHHHHLLPDRR